MTLERLLAEIESKGSEELGAAERRHAETKAGLEQDRDRRIKELTESITRAGDEEATRLRQRYQSIKERLRRMAKEQGIVRTEDG